MGRRRGGVAGADGGMDPRMIIELLRELVRMHPEREDFLKEAASIALELNWMEFYAVLVERLRALRPDEPENVLDCAGTWLELGATLNAKARLAEFLQRFPDHPFAADAQEARALLGARADDSLQGMGLRWPDDEEAGRLVEVADNALKAGELDDAEVAARQACFLLPTFDRASYILSLCQWVRRGDPRELSLEIEEGPDPSPVARVGRTRPRRSMDSRRRASPKSDRRAAVGNRRLH